MESEGEAEACGWLVFVEEIMEGEVCSVSPLVARVLDVSPNDPDVMASDEFALELAEPFLPVPAKLVSEVETVVDDTKLDML